MAPIYTNAVMAKMAEDVLALVNQVKMAYNRSCHLSLTEFVENCTRNNYDSCVSMLPSPSCYNKEQYSDRRCSSGVRDTTCGALIDKTVSNVVLHFKVSNGPNGNPPVPQVSLSMNQINKKVPSWKGPLPLRPLSTVHPWRRLTQLSVTRYYLRNTS